MCMDLNFMWLWPRFRADAHSIEDARDHLIGPSDAGAKEVACAACHHPDFGYAERLDLSIGARVAPRTSREVQRPAIARAFAFGVSIQLRKNEGRSRRSVGVSVRFYVVIRFMSM